RYLLYNKVTDESSIERLSSEDYRDINGAIFAFSLLGLYVDNGYVSEQDAMEAWSITIVRAWEAAKPSLAHPQLTPNGAGRSRKSRHRTDGHCRRSSCPHPPLGQWAPLGARVAGREEEVIAISRNSFRYVHMIAADLRDLNILELGEKLRA